MGKTYKPTWRTFFELGKEELRKEKYELAIGYFQKSIKYTKDENSKTLNLVYLAISNYYLKKLDESIYYATNLFNKKNKYHQTLFWNLINYLDIKNDTKSLHDLKTFFKILEKIIYKNKSHICIKNSGKLINEIYYMRAGVSHCLGQLRWALFYYSKAISYSKEYQKTTEKKDISWIYTDRASAYISKGLYKKAIQDINNAISIEERNYRAFLYAGDIYKHFKNYNLAISMYSRALLWSNSIFYKKEEYIYALMHRGYLKIKNENIEDALEDFEQAYYTDKYCLRKYHEITKKIPQGVKTILRINSRIKI